ncbi:putative nucleic acid-binding protein, contains PIN domain [Candidatus Methanophagaceae archaeon]|nr:putative nucleic acid-binding protein, contains PIN domain [Methanophagales archaeon]
MLSRIFTDCVSFVAMWRKGIKEAFAFDEHFNQMGFIRKP